jgi:hypothetical protein
MKATLNKHNYIYITIVMTNRKKIGIFLYKEKHIRYKVN